QLQILLTQIPAVLHRNSPTSKLSKILILKSCARNKVKGDLIHGLAVGAEHRPVDAGLRRRYGCIAVPHEGPRDESSLDDDLRLDAEKRRLPQDQVRKFTHLQRSNSARDAVSDRGIDRVLGNITFDAEIIVLRAVAAELSALLFHLVGGLPR